MSKRFEITRRAYSDACTSVMHAAEDPMDGDIMEAVEDYVENEVKDLLRDPVSFHNEELVGILTDAINDNEEY